jgi:hypothetical protein
MYRVQIAVQDKPINPSHNLCMKIEGASDAVKRVYRNQNARKVTYSRNSYHGFYLFDLGQDDRSLSNARQSLYY